MLMMKHRPSSTVLSPKMCAMPWFSSILVSLVTGPDTGMLRMLGGHWLGWETGAHCTDWALPRPGHVTPAPREEEPGPGASSGTHQASPALISGHSSRPGSSHQLGHPSGQDKICS